MHRSTSVTTTVQVLPKNSLGLAIVSYLQFTLLFCQNTTSNSYACLDFSHCRLWRLGCCASDQECTVINMKYLIYSVFLIVCFPYPRYSVAATGDETAFGGIATFEEARNAWVDNVSCFGTYEFKRSICYSENEASSVVIPEQDLVARGVFCKIGKKIRFTVLYSHAPLAASLGRVQDRSSDCIVNGRFWISFFYDQGEGFPNTGSIARTKEEGYRTCPELINLDSPLSLSLKSLQDLPASLKTGKTPYLSPVDTARVAVELESEPKVDVYFRKTITFRVDTKLPVIEKIVVNRLRIDSQEALSSRTQEVTKWSEIAGEAIPSCIRSFAGPSKSVGNEKDIWIVSEWKSPDLGVRPANSEDFVLHLPNGTARLSGMKYAPSDQTIDIDAITDEDLLSEGDLESSRDANGQSAEGSKSSPLRWFAAIAIIGAILLICNRAFRSRRHFTATP